MQRQSKLPTHGRSRVFRETVHLRGFLPSVLRRRTEFDWTFLTLPTTWRTFTTIKKYDTYDVAIHLGLGVYGEVYNVIKVEHGAINLREGADASGALPGSSSTGAGATSLDPADPISVNIKRIENQTYAGFKIVRGNPRRENSYICNETNSLALEAVRRSRAARKTLSEAYFLHLPYADPGVAVGYKNLAKGVAATILALLEGRGKPSRR
ncbi:MAG: hypothetical protein KUG77_00820 [Nannocystaceae bacterium]|nr:hypothetical protein [Nannocystaceae bacterium]